MKIYSLHKLYLCMKNLVFITLLSLLPVSAMSQKVNVQVIKTDKVGSSEWQVLNEQYQTIISGNDYPENDSVSFSLDANTRYFLNINVIQIYNPDTLLYTFRLNNEPIISVNSGLSAGDHVFPFYTGVRITDVKITGGTDAVISDFPWQVYFIAGAYRCGASLISDTWAVTAAHCTRTSSGNSISVSQMSIKVGANNPYNVLDGKTYNVSQVIVHEGFNSETLEDDIALLKLESPVNYPNAVPIKLISAEDVAEGATDPGVMSWVTGWGLTHVSPDVLPLILQKVQLPIVSNAQASTVWRSIPSTVIMAGYLNGNKDACNGDSGGPLVVNVLGEYKLAGIVSWGSLNCNTYGGYTRVSTLESWIRTKSGIATPYKPPSPAGEAIVCQGTEPGVYSTDQLPSATTYEWRLYPADAGAITGNTWNSAVLWNLAYTGSVAVMVRVTVNNVISDWSKLNVKIVKNTKLLSQSRDTTLCEAQPIKLVTGAEGNNLNYEWYRNNTSVQSGTSSQLSISSSSPGNSGDYVCKITGSCGTVFSGNMKMTVYPLTSINSITPDTEVPFGSDITLDVSAEGHDLNYQWKKDNVLIGNSNTPQLVLNNVNASDIGLYLTTVEGTCGTRTSDTVYVYVKRGNYTNEPEVFAWPSVTSGEVNLALSNDDSYTIRLFNATGKLISEQTNCRYQTIIDLSARARGMYILNVFNGNFRKSVKVIKV
jgi:hypothetical protein